MERRLSPCQQSTRACVDGEIKFVVCRSFLFVLSLRIFEEMIVEEPMEINKHRDLFVNFMLKN